MKPLVEKHIDSHPDKCGGKPCVAGTRIHVQDIYVWHELQNKSPDEIVSDFPELTLASVYAALAYFFDHQEEIRKEMREEDAFVKQLCSVNGLGPLETKLQTSSDAPNDSVSS